VAGLALGALTIGWPVAATLAGRVYLRIGFRITTILGGVILVFGTSALALVSLVPSIWLVAAACFVIGAGFGFSAVTSLVAAQSSVDWKERGVVTGTQMLFRSVGQSIGAAALGATANGVIAAHGGDETNRATMMAAAGAVFLAAAIVAVLLLAAAIALPRLPIPARQAANVQPPTGSEKVVLDAADEAAAVAG
jgi:MFS family permease